MSSKDYLEHTCKDRTPYTYLIGWSSLNKWYYGVRYAKGCHPSDLFVSYFTSSKHVKKFIENNGNPDVIQVRKTFDSVMASREYENKVLLRLDVIHKQHWLNKTTNRSISPERAGHSKGKTYEEIYGVERAAELKAIRAQSNKNRKLQPWDERKGDREHKNKGAHKTGVALENHSNALKLRWSDVEYRISLMQSRGRHFTEIQKCPNCGRYCPTRKNRHAVKFCSRSCGNSYRKKVDIV